MTAALLLAGYVVGASVLAPRLLRRVRWVVRAPRLAITVWMGLVVTTLAGAALFGCEVAEAALGAGLWECCLHFSAGRWSLPGEALPVLAGVTLTLGPLGRVMTVVLIDVLRLCRSQRRQTEALDLLGRPVETYGRRTVTLDHASPAAYCVAGKGGRVVLTTAALTVLPRAELTAVLEHEKAHLRGRHYLLTACAASLARALPGVPLFSSAGPAIARLVEMAADDAAARHVCGKTVARGLAMLMAAPDGAVGRMGASVLNASGHHVAERINRLLDTCGSERKRSAAAGAGWLMGLVVTPLSAIAATAAFWC
jgi:Zn-dependent protease with chaperone function